MKLKFGMPRKIDAFISVLNFYNKTDSNRILAFTCKLAEAILSSRFSTSSRTCSSTWWLRLANRFTSSSGFTSVSVSVSIFSSSFSEIKVTWNFKVYSMGWQQTWKELYTNMSKLVKCLNTGTFCTMHIYISNNVVSHIVRDISRVVSSSS